MATALALLERGQAVVIFPEGTRIRTGSLARAEARRRAAGAAERLPRGADRGHGLRARAPRLADQAREGAHPLSARRSPSRAWRSPRASSRPRSRSGSGPACSSSGSGSAACRRSARPPSWAPGPWAPRPLSCSRARGSRCSSAAARGAQAETLRSRARERALPARGGAQGRDRREDRARDRVRRASTSSCSPSRAPACPAPSARSARGWATARRCWWPPRASFRRSARRPPRS